MTTPYEKTIQKQSDTNDAIRVEERKRVGSEFWKWWWAEDGESKAHAIKRITGVPSPKELPEGEAQE